MVRDRIRKMPFPPDKSYILVAVGLTILGLLLIAMGFFFAADSILRLILQALGGAVISLGWVEVLHEWAVARKVREEFLVLGDFIEKGIERVCTEEEIALEGRVELSRTKELEVIGIGASWLIKGANYDRLIEILNSNHRVRILIPDPLSREINERYVNDEPAEFDLGLEGLAGRIRAWHALAKQHSSLDVRVYDRYPVANIVCYDRRVFVSPVLYKRRAKDGLTAIYRRPSKGSEIYEDHFQKVFDEGSKELNSDYLAKLNEQFPQGMRAQGAKSVFTVPSVG